jgi:DNA mismatch endonuclease (patch repair protein)
MPDRLSPARRSWNMSRIKGMDTNLERIVRRCAYTRGLRYRIHVMSLPGRPDMVFFRERVVVFIDGDFWHGWLFPRWSGRLRPYWKEKIERNRRRDTQNFRKLRGAGWTVLRVWEHEVKSDVEICVDRIVSALEKARRLPMPTARPRSTRAAYPVRMNKYPRVLRAGIQQIGDDA